MLEHAAQEFKETAPLSLTGLLPQRPPHEDSESAQINLICRNKQNESPKIGRQRNIPQSKGKEESPERVLNEI